VSPVEVVASVVVGLLALAFGEAICGVIGYAAVAVLSLGRIQGEGAEDGKLRFPWHGFARSKTGNLVVESQVATLIGALFLVGSIVLYIAWRAGALS
jgi:hypothetical protein